MSDDIYEHLYTTIETGYYLFIYSLYTFYRYIMHYTCIQQI